MELEYVVDHVKFPYMEAIADAISSLPSDIQLVEGQVWLSDVHVLISHAQMIVALSPRRPQEITLPAKNVQFDLHVLLPKGEVSGTFYFGLPAYELSKARARETITAWLMDELEVEA